MKSIKTTICALTLALATSSCINVKEPKPKEETSKVYHFESFGKMKTYTGAKAIGTGDFDGDGDTDFIVAYQDGTIALYENKIHQKNKK